MLDFNFEPPARVSPAEVNKTVRSGVDRRAANSANQPSQAPQPKRRRHDGLYSGKPVPLHW